MENLDVIFNKYDTDKNTFFHNYTRQYNTLLNDFRDKPIKYLEIGVLNGGSVKAFRETFKKSTCILGLDIDNRCKAYENVENNIFIEIGDATDRNFIEKITNKYGSFDIVLDDASHTNKDVIKSTSLVYDPFPVNKNDINRRSSTIKTKCNRRGGYDRYNDYNYSPEQEHSRYDRYENRRGGYDRYEDRRGGYDRYEDRRGGYDRYEDRRDGYDRYEDRRGGYDRYNDYTEMYGGNDIELNKLREDIGRTNFDIELNRLRNELFIIRNNL